MKKKINLKKVGIIQRTLLVVGLGLLTSFSRTAYADFAPSVSAYGILNYSAKKISDPGSSSTSTARAAPGVGVSFGLIPLGVLGTVEVGAEFMYRNIEYNTYSTESSKYFKVPVYLRYTLFPFLDLLGGAYAAYGIGEIDSKVQTSSGANSIEVSSSYDQSNMERLDYGLLAGLGWSYDMFMVQFRFNYGLADLNKNPSLPSRTVKFQDYMLLLGARF